MALWSRCRSRVRRMHLVLASGSPRRSGLIGSLGLDFEVRVPDVDESPLAGEDPRSYVLRLAREKALAVAGPGETVLGADTTVVHGGDIIGKPRGRRNARRMLSRLQGTTHTVLTGVALVRRGDPGLCVDVECSRSDVRMQRMTESEIFAYVETGEPLDKAGAYALQGIGAAFVAEVRGSPTNVIGLPLDLAVRMLRSAGIEVLGGTR